MSVGSRIVVVTGEPLAERMAGPAIRAWEIACALSLEHDVVLASLGPCSVDGRGFRAMSASPRELAGLEEWCDVLIFQGFLLDAQAWLHVSEKIIVADIYDPFHLEQLEQVKQADPSAQREMVANTVRIINEQLARADFLMCASDKQRDLWLGQLAAVGRINPLTYDEDPTLHRLLDVVPFGVPSEPPAKRTRRVRGVIPGIGERDRVVLWGGGIYNWFDPLTLIRAVDRVRADVPDVRLLFMGMRHPNPGVPAMRMALDAQALSAELGLTGVHVFFNEDWVPYDERADFLLDADVAVSCHLHHIETEYSFRTRILDYLWAGRPVVTTSGDTFATVIERSGAGLVVPPEDVDALADALRRLLTDDVRARACAARSAELAERYRWPIALRPLIEFCRDPRRAPDAGLAPPDPGVAGDPRAAYRPTDWRADVELVRAYLREGGLQEVFRRAGGRLRRVVGARLPGAARSTSGR